MKCYTRSEMVEQSGATPDELDRLVADRLLVPNRPWRPFGPRPELYTQSQLGVLRWVVETRRVLARREPLHGHLSKVAHNLPV
jgi:hypothetical protein